MFAFGVALDRFVRRGGLGRIYLAPVDVILDEERHLIVQPDLVFISAPRLGIVRDRIWGAPDLVLEVLSPWRGNVGAQPRVGDLNERLAWFAAYGVRECWLLHQEKRILEVVPFVNGKVAASRVFTEAATIRSSDLPGWDQMLTMVLSEFKE